MVRTKGYLKSRSASTSRGAPLLNSLFTEQFSRYANISTNTGYKTYMAWARKSPQLMGFINILATDILSDDIEFFPLNRNDSGRNKVKQSQKFWNENEGLEVIEEMLYDFFITGIGYNWIGAIDEKSVKEYCLAIAKKIYPTYEKKELEIKADRMYDTARLSKELNLAKKLRYVASSTMSINADRHKVTGYSQTVGGNAVKFNVDEIIPFKLMPLDGKIYPFPPMEALLAEVYLIWLISQNYVSFFENGGKPDNVFILPKELAGSKNHEYLIETLKKYKKIQNKHGNLVFTGDLSVEQLQKAEQQMENKELSLYIISVFAQFYGVPVSRIPFLVGKSATGGDSGGLADSGYWRKISVWQSKIETPLNNRLWNPYFGTQMKFGRGYLQDDVRETQTEMQKTQIAEQRLALGLWPIKEAGRYLKIDEDIVDEAQKEKKEREAEELKSGMLLQNNNNNKDVQRNPDQKQKASVKQTTQNNNQTKAGGKKINP